MLTTCRGCFAFESAGALPSAVIRGCETASIVSVARATLRPTGYRAPFPERTIFTVRMRIIRSIIREEFLM
jgi:hypothetical protein